MFARILFEQESAQRVRLELKFYRKELQPK
jgi:hypothetical protein